jgi:ABC-type multidrug transport system ATPase subunit
MTAERTRRPTTTDRKTVVLKAAGLGKDYDDRPALLPLDLSVVRGEQIALVGHNGSGKSTFLKMAAGVLTPTEGTVTITGEAVASIPARAALSYLADTPTFYDDLSVWEHLEYVARLHGVESWEQSASDLLGHLGIFERADDLPTTFSRGLRQKAAIALAFVRPYQLMLVDEPFVGLDAFGRGALIELFEERAAAGSTLVVATHELTFADKVTRMVALSDGEVVHDGEATEELARQLLG